MGLPSRRVDKGARSVTLSDMLMRGRRSGIAERLCPPSSPRSSRARYLISTPTSPARCECPGGTNVKLNLGCGRHREPGWINADVRLSDAVDVRLDAEKPLPFKTRSLAGIRAIGLLEHLWHWENLMMEAARVLHPGADFEISVPHKMDYVAHHVRHFDENTFNPYRSDYVPRELDFVRRPHTWGSLEFQEPFFTLRDLRFEHRVPFSWHLEKYLHVDASRLPLGRKLNLVVILRRNDTPWRP